MADYNIQLGVDPKGFLTGLDEIEAALDATTTKAKNATAAMSAALDTSAKAGDTLVSKMNAGATAAKNFQEAATKAGVSLETAFSANKVKTGEISEKINVFVAKMKDVIGKPIDFKFNLDKGSTDLLKLKLNEAKGQVQGFQIVIDAATERLKKLGAGSDEFNKLNAQIEEANKFINVLKEDAGDVSFNFNEPIQSATSLRAQLRLMREELAALEISGQGGSERFIELSQRAGELSDQIGDTSQRIKALASDTKGLDAGITAVRGLAGAFAIGQGALAAFGVQSEEAAIAIQKVQGAMAILQGVQEVANVLNKDSALSIYLQTYATTAHTTAVVAETTAITAEAAATEAATVATASWTVALLANPITAIVAVLAVAVAALYEFSQAQKESGISADNFNKILEEQNKLLQLDYDRVERRTKVDEAEATAQRKHQSVLTGIQINALRQKQIYDQMEIDEVIGKLSQLDREDKNYQKAYDDGNKKIEELENQRRNRSSEILALEINQQKEYNDETNKLQRDLLKQRQENYDAERAILKEANQYAAELTNTRISELRDGQDKEILSIRQGVAEKIKALSEEGEANRIKLENQRKELALDLETDKKVLALKRDSLNRQIALEVTATEKRNELIKELEKLGQVQVNEVVEKYSSERAESDKQVAITLLSIKDQGEKEKISILQISAARELEILEATNKSVAEKNNVRFAIEQKLKADIARTKLESGLERLQIEKTANENLINEAKNNEVNNVRTRDFYNILLLKNEQDNARAQLDLLIKSGKALTSQEVVNAQARVTAAEGAVKAAVANKPAVTIGQLLFPGATDKELASIESSVSTALSSVSQAISDYSSTVIDRYQKIVDAKKAAVQADEDAINSLESQLKREQDLRDAGYASNIAGINAELAAKIEMRKKDVQEQEDAQKKLEKSQKAQADAQTALQAANLITASTNIYLQATAVGGPLAVPFAIAAITAMIAAFAISKVKTYESISEGTTKFAEGGEVKGKSHAQGGQKYYSPDSSAGVMELEADEFVVRKTQAQKYKPLLEVINNNSIGGMSDVDIKNLLAGLGVHMDIEDEHREALREANTYTTNIIAANTPKANTPEELKSIDRNIQRMVEQQQITERVYEENGYIVTVKGNKTTRIRKK